ncbi:hypothetical protein A6C57_27255 (plasmid) [Fibrella sp. ES10-3-2-2]
MNEVSARIRIRRILFRVGAFLIVIGAAIATFIPFFLYLYLIPLWIFLLGVVLIWFSESSLKRKITWSLTPVLMFGIYQLLWYQFNKAPAETFIIQRGFKGKIHIHFNERCGQKPEEENHRRLYKIPSNGILLSQFSDKQGFIDQQYYLADNTGKRTLLPQLDVQDYNEEWTREKNPHEPSRDILGVFHAGRVSSDGMYEFYVCTHRQLTDSLDFEYDKQFELKEQKAIELCRKARK